MARPLYRLSISCVQSGAVFRVTDGNSKRVGTGMYRLDLDLPPGLYTVSALLGACIESKTVLLDRPKAVEIEVPYSSFGDRAYGLMARVFAQLPASYWAAGATSMIALRGPFGRRPSRKDEITIDVDGAPVEPVAAELLKDVAGHLWQWQAFRIADATAGHPDIITAVRAVNGVKTSHVIPRFGRWAVWAAYPAPEAVAPKEAELPLPHYVRLRLTQPGVPPSAAMQSLSDQVFTALASRSALPMSRPVLDLLFDDAADPLLTLAAAHLISLKLAWYGLLPMLPQDEAGTARPAATDSKETAEEEDEPVPPTELQRRVADWLGHGSQEIGHCPDLVAVRFLYGLCDELDLVKPPVLLRSLDALIKAEHTASDRGKSCQLGDSVWRARFQVSDSFAYFQWETDARKGEQKRLKILEQSFEISKALEQSVQELRQARAKMEQARASAVGGEQPPDSSEAAAAPAAGQPTQPPPRYSGNLFQRAGQTAAEGRYAAAQVLAKVTGSSAWRDRATHEFDTYLKLHAQALRVPSSAVDALQRQFAKTRMKSKS